MIRAAYLAAEELEAVLGEELLRAGVTVSGWHGRLALSPDPPVVAVWALEVWTAPVEIAVASVKAAADALRGIQRNWAAYAAVLHRRTALIGARLPVVSGRPLVFPQAAPGGHLGGWTLLAANRLLASPTKSSPFVNGECRFEEDHIGPPSRAYLKLWEALARLGTWPGPGTRCIDLGAAPGGWSWVLGRLGAAVLAIDRAPLDPRMAEMTNVVQRVQNAFAVMPEPCDWLFSDVIAYPGRLLELVQRWVSAGCVQRIVCTVKFQGTTDFAACDAFAAIAGGRLVHLFHNKHELTFCWAQADAVAAMPPR